ncbi:exopolysaccharide biosynthesis protein [Pseudomonas luteola]|uniref:exopolysaccharide biosynthesis protein n=1 Tax=Pseudomonas luteola TaxID=47886 RepID=UPI001239A95A|nr:MULTISPECIES: exopolysaccharide biosynthesis protein [Pseudomonas]MBA1246088.1 exopolysaccharide biosynthesis protein [Pseudomonas zeshuii]QEU27503.1 exopolysaccharide biosynthesis protein [Pseudomonas luteola]
MSNRNNTAKSECLEDVIDGVIELGKEKDKISVGDIKREIGQRSYGPFLFVPSIIEISPVGGVPGASTFFALIVAVFALQMLFGRNHFWMPQFLAKRSVKSQKIESGLNKVRKVIRGLDKVIRPRLGWATQKTFVRLIAAICLILTTSVPPLEFIPFASLAPFSAICLFGLGLTAKDGVVVLLGMAVSLIAFYLAITGVAGG